MPDQPYRAQASSYALRGLTGTDYLAFRAVAEEELMRGQKVLDLGCGTGRSTRFLKDLGFEVTGADISSHMINEAKLRDSSGDYLLLALDVPFPFSETSFDSVFSSWMLVEQDSSSRLLFLMQEVRRVLKPGGLAVLVTNTPDFYRGKWISCEVGFPENTPPLRSGQVVRVRLMPEGVELSDYFWSDDDYKETFRQAGLHLAGECRPLGQASDSIAWREELHLAPYVIYLLERD